MISLRKHLVWCRAPARVHAGESHLETGAWYSRTWRFNARCWRDSFTIPVLGIFFFFYFLVIYLFSYFLDFQNSNFAFTPPFNVIFATWGFISLEFISK